MRYLKTFESYSVNEEFNRFDINKWLASAAGIFGSAINLITFKWSKIPDIWRNVGQYHTLMNVMKHITEVAKIEENNPNEHEWVEVILSYVDDKLDGSGIFSVEGEPIIKYSEITSGPSKSDLSMAYTLMSYDGDLERDVIDSMDLIDKLPAEKKINLKDVTEMLKSFLGLLKMYKEQKGETPISKLM